jgi:hypothetical protein
MESVITLQCDDVTKLPLAGTQIGNGVSTQDG